MTNNGNSIGGLLHQHPECYVDFYRPRTTPIYRLSLTPRTVKAINYQHRSGATKIDFRGTELLPNARGEAKVESKRATSRSKAEFDGLQPATSNGPEYLTYVLWAVTPEGRTANLGEVLLDGTKSKLKVTTELQVFGLVVTAEPYYAVTQPSDLIVMENVVRPDTRERSKRSTLNTNCLQRGQYQRLANPLASEAGPERAAGTLRSAQCRADRARRGRRPLCNRDLPKGREQPGAGRRLPGHAMPVKRR